MLSSIHPLGERARGNRWGITTTAYVSASLVGGGVVGAAAGTIGWLAARLVRPGPAAVAFLVAGSCLLAALLDTPVLPRAVPTVHRQVNEDWLHRYRGWVYGVGFGFQLGLGVVTIVTTAGVYLTFFLAVLAGLQTGRHGVVPAALSGSLVGGTFGLVRAMPVLLVAWVRSPAQLRATHRVMGARAAVARWATIAGLTGVAVVAGTYSWRQ